MEKSRYSSWKDATGKKSQIFASAALGCVRKGYRKLYFVNLVYLQSRHTPKADTYQTSVSHLPSWVVQVDVGLSRRKLFHDTDRHI
jgi:hypothetical protein